MINLKRGKILSICIQLIVFTDQHLWCASSPSPLLLKMLIVEDCSCPKKKGNTDVKGFKEFLIQELLIQTFLHTAEV